MGPDPLEDPPATVESLWVGLAVENLEENFRQKLTSLQLQMQESTRLGPRDCSNHNALSVKRGLGVDFIDARRKADRCRILAGDSAAQNRVQVHSVRVQQQTRRYPLVKVDPYEPHINFKHRVNRTRLARELVHVRLGRRNGIFWRGHFCKR